MDCAAALPAEIGRDLAIRLLDSAMTVTHAIRQLSTRHVEALTIGDARTAADLKQALDYLAEARHALASSADIITGTQTT